MINHSLLRMSSIDTHCHVHMDAAGPEALPAGIAHAVTMGTGPSDWDAVERWAADERVVPAFGVHPWNGDEAVADEGWAAALRARLEAHPEALVGECGLDKAKGPPMDVQVAILETQLRMAAELRRPVSLHCVRAFGPMLQLLSRLAKDASMAGLPALALHSFTGKPSMAESLRKIPRLGKRIFFGFAPVINGRLARIEPLLRAVPLDRLLLESDRAEAAPCADDLAEMGAIARQHLGDAASDAQLHANALAFLGWQAA